MEELFGEPAEKERAVFQNPSLAETAESRLSEPTLEKAGKDAGGTSKLYKPATAEKKSVREQIHRIQAERKKEAEGNSGREMKEPGGGSRNQKPFQRTHLQAGKKTGKAKAS